jgi:hypothetical protein
MADGIKIEFDQTKIEAVVQAAILDQLDDAKRDAILAQAIQYLVTTPPSGGYGYGTRFSPIQDAFNGAVSSVARRIALEMVENDPEIERQIREAVGQATIASAVGNYKELALAEALAAVFARDR